MIELPKYINNQRVQNGHGRLCRVEQSRDFKGNDKLAVIIIDSSIRLRIYSSLGCTMSITVHHSRRTTAALPYYSYPFLYHPYRLLADAR